MVLECRCGLYLQKCLLIKESCGKASLLHKAHGGGEEGERVCVCVVCDCPHPIPSEERAVCPGNLWQGPSARMFSPVRVNVSPWVQPRACP